MRAIKQMLRLWRFITLMLAALGLAMGAAHVLELGPKLGYEPELYAAVTSTLYRFFGAVGAPIQVAAVAASVVLAFLVRRTPASRATSFGAFALAASLALWGAFVAPVNAEWAHVIETAPEAVPAAYAHLRERWEYGHVIAFAAWFCGFCFLLASVVNETPATALRRAPP